MTGTEFSGLFIGITLLALGTASTIAATFRLRRGSVTLLTFGLWTALYGARLLALQPPVRATMGGAPQQWAFFVAFVTYTINIPITLFVISLVGSGWRHSARWLLVALIAFAAIATALDLVSGRPGTAAGANTWFVLASLLIGVGNIVYVSVARGERTPLTAPIVGVGGIVLGLFVLNENLGRIIAPDMNIEPVGVAVFTLCLGYAVGRSVLRAEAEFLGVQRELEHARQIQLSLLPKQIPDRLGLDVAVRYVPTTAVAGDIYDFIEIGPSCLGIYVADVMGHGIPAALVASMVKLAFSMQTGQARDPARVMASVNEILSRHLDRSYVTAVYAVVDTEVNTVTLANAGHPPPMFRRAGEAMTRAEHEHGLLLGFTPDAQYTNVRVEPFVVGDRLLLYSDGVLEATGPDGTFFDSHRVAQWLSHTEAITADRIADLALDELTRWTGRRRFDDDVTFVVVKR